MKKTISVLLIAFVVAFAASAQAAEKSRVLNFEIGALVGYDLSASDAVGGTSFGFGLAVADNMSIGVQIASLSDSYSLFTMTYFLNPALGFVTSIGQDTTASTTAAGFGAFYTLGTSTPQTGLSSEYKIKADFLFPVSDISAGAIAISVALSFGI